VLLTLVYSEKRSKTGKFEKRKKISFYFSFGRLNPIEDFRDLASQLCDEILALKTAEIEV
jgi:hypothetical protein